MINDKTSGNLLVGYINPNGLFSDGKLKIGMKINSINGKCMDGVKSETAAQLIRESKGRIVFPLILVILVWEVATGNICLY